MKSLILINYVIKAAIRDRLILGVSLMLVLATALSFFMASAAITEQDQFAAVFSAGSIRILNAVGLVLFIVFLSAAVSRSGTSNSCCPALLDV